MHRYEGVTPDAPSLVRRAGELMCQARAAGRNQVIAAGQDLRPADGPGRKSYPDGMVPGPRVV